MRDVAIVSFAQTPAKRREALYHDAEIAMFAVKACVERIGLSRKDVDFVCSGSTDFLSGVPFSFVSGLDAVGAWPPMAESHVESDAAWALYEAWVKIQTGEYDTALVYGFSSCSTPDSLDEVLATQLDPYTLTPLWPAQDALAALQARALLDAGRAAERNFAEVAARSLRNAKDNPNAQEKGDFSVEELLARPYVASPLRAHDRPPISDGAAAVVLAAGDAARALCERPAWIRGIDHRVEAHALGVRDLARSASAALAGEKAGVSRDKVDVAELHAPYSPQELILRDALGLKDAARVNPSGGALAAHPMIAAGLIRLGEVADRIIAGKADRGVAHATQGPCLQHNLVCVLEGK